MVPELVDGLAAWRTASLRIAAGVAPLQREVLPQQHAQLVGGVVQLGPGDVTVDAQQVEPGLAGQLDVVAELGRVGVAERHARRCQVRALDEHPLAVDREHPVLQHDLAQPGAHACARR